ncbi:MAG: ribonuclease III [Mycoplasmoidaceae bacterium]|nr:MAG: ribonuclease III [Mycoplasmoidaceae bacterium]
MSSYTIVNLLNKFKITPKDMNIYTTAFTHVSYRNSKKLTFDYEKLEFLGDAIINKVISEWLYKNKSSWNVGDMSKTRALITQGKTEALAAKSLNLQQLIYYSGDKNKIVDSVMEDVYEAFIGAVYLDCGEKKAKEIIDSTITVIYEKNRGDIKDDFKTKLQELSYKIFKIFPTYKSSKLPNNEYRAKLYIGKKCYSTGDDKKIKDAEQKAAKLCYVELSKNK